MKKIINGKMYDTATAEALAIYEAKYPETDFKHYKETLFKKKTGELFLYGAGNASTKYASHDTESAGFGEDIIPYSIERAKVWAEKHINVELYISIFGEVEE